MNHGNFQNGVDFPIMQQDERNAIENNIAPNIEINEQVNPQLHNFQFDALQFLANPNNPERAILHMLHDRILDIVYLNQNKNKEAMDISEATFETLYRLLQHKTCINSLFHENFVSNLFGPYLGNQAFFDKLEEFDTAVWRVQDALYQVDDLIVGTVSFSASDQQIRFSMKYSVAERHFGFINLIRIQPEKNEHRHEN